MSHRLTNHRFAFSNNRVEHFMKNGIPEDVAHSKAHGDFMSVMALAADCKMELSNEELEGKGVTRCNRTACQSDKHVVFFNSVMRKNYCLNCATDIRFSNNLNELDLYPDYNKTLDKLINDNVEVL